MTAPDLLTAVRRFLLSNAGVAGHVGTRVWGEEVPQSETDNMPRKGVLIRRAGGYVLGVGYIEIGDPRFDIYAYGGSPFDAGQVFQSLYIPLKQMRRNIQGPALLHWARPAGGPVAMRDPDTEWPMVLSVWQILGAEREVV